MLRQKVIRASLKGFLLAKSGFKIVSVDYNSMEKKRMNGEVRANSYIRIPTSTCRRWFFFKSQFLHSAILSGTFFAETHKLKHHVNSCFITFTSLYYNCLILFPTGLWGLLGETAYMTFVFDSLYQIKYLTHNKCPTVHVF